jgi:hypothetical protein
VTDAAAAGGGATGAPEFVELFKQDLAPGVLMPSADPEDAVVMNVAGFPIRKSHLYDRLFEENPRRAKEQVDILVFDILLAQQAGKHGIAVDPAMIDGIVAEEEKRLVGRVEKDWGSRMSVDDFLQFEKGVDRKVYRMLLRRHLARRLYRHYVIRYLALLEDRVKVRIIKHRERPTIARILEQVREGAEFHTLALRESEDETQRLGGELPPFGRDHKSIYTEVAFKLAAGEVSDILSTTQAGAPIYFLVYCVRHMPGRKVPFAAVKAELDREWLTNPPTPPESRELYLRLRSRSEGLKNGPRKR